MKYPLVSKRNIPAYLVIAAAWVLFTVVFAWIHVHLLMSLTIGKALVLSGVSVMSGMSIMFVASAVNLRKLRPGFVRLAQGEENPEIPAVWCPVLTMATRAAVELNERFHAAKQEVRS